MSSRGRHNTIVMRLIVPTSNGTHTPADCRVCQKFLQKKSGNEDTSTDTTATNLVNITGDDSSVTQESNADENL